MPTSGKRSGVRVLCVLLLAAALGGAHATLGMDISIYQGAVGSSTWGCIVNSGYSFALVQAIDGGKYNDALAGNVVRRQRQRARGDQGRFAWGVAIACECAPLWLRAR
jgi:hypothetical protein